MAERVIIRDGSWKNGRGDVLRTFTLLPADAVPKALLVWHHGFSEHAERHLHVLRELVQQAGVMVLTYDCHGHGKSGPFNPTLRAHVRHWHHLRDDLLDIIDQVAVPAAEDKGVPAGRVFVGGHSMGGMTALTAAIARPGKFAGVMLSSPLVCVRVRQTWLEWLQILVLRLLSILFPTLPLLPRKPASVGMRDPEAAHACTVDPLWYKGRVHAATCVSCIDATEHIKANAHKITVPLYIQQGTMDRTCQTVCLRRVMPHFGSGDVTYFEVQGAYHDLAHDPDTPQCIDRMVAWARTHCAASATVAVNGSNHSSSSVSKLL